MSFKSFQTQEAKFYSTEKILLIMRLKAIAKNNAKTILSCTYCFSLAVISFVFYL